MLVFPSLACNSGEQMLGPHPAGGGGAQVCAVVEAWL